MHIKQLKYLLFKIVNLGVDDSLSYVEERRVKLLNVIIFSLLSFLIFFSILNFFQGRYTLLLGDIISIILVCIPAIILQYKKNIHQQKRW